MIYRGSFYDVNNIIYRIELDTKSGSKVKEIEFSEMAAEISYSGDDNIFAPLKLSGATIRCMADAYMFDLFTGDAKGVTCNIFKGDVILWSGYVTPNIYNQDYLQNIFDFEIECVDNLSITKYIMYASSDHKNKSILSIITNIMSLAGLTGNLFISNFSANKISDLYINEENFFDEDGVAMSCKEVMEHILTYLCLTAFQVGTDVYIVNYTLLKNGPTHDFNKYISGAFAGIESVKTGVEIPGYLDTPTLSLSEVFNGVTVKNSLYQFGDIMPDIFDKKALNKRLLANKIEQTDTLSGFGSGTKTQTWKHYAELLDNNNVSIISYNKDGSVYKGEINTGNYDSYYGTSILKSWGYDVGAVNNGSEKLPGKANFEYYLRCSMFNQSSYSKRLVFNGKEFVNLQGGYIGINAEVYLSKYGYLYFPEFGKNASPDKTIDNNNNVKLGISIKIGDKYIGEGGAPTSTSYLHDISVGKHGDRYINNWLSVNNTNTYLDDSSMSGYIIKIPDSILYSGKVVITLYGARPWNIPDIPVSYIKDFTVEYKYRVPAEYSLTEDEAETDTLYSGCIDSVNVSEFGDIELNVCTKNGKGNSKAAMLLLDGGLSYLGELSSFATNKTQVQEYNILEEYINQYKQPNKVIDGEIEGIVMPYCKFVLDGENYIVGSSDLNLRTNTSNLKLIQKR